VASRPTLIPTVGRKYQERHPWIDCRAETHLLSNHYNQTRTEYYRQPRDASRGDGDTLPFLSYALQGFVDGLRQQLGVIRIEAFRPVAAESSESA